MKNSLLYSSGKTVIGFFLILVFPLFVNAQSVSQNSNRHSLNFTGNNFQTSPGKEMNFIPEDTAMIIHTIPMPGILCNGLTWDGTALWCADIQGDMIYRIDPEDGNILKSFESPGSLIEGLAFDGQYLWCDDINSGDIYKIDTDDGAVLDSIHLVSIHFLGITWADENLWITDFDNHQLDEVDPVTGEILLTLDSPEPNCTGLAWDGDYLWTNDFTLQECYCLDPVDGTVVYQISVPITNPRDMAWDGEYLWVMSWADSTVYQVNVGDITSVENRRSENKSRSLLSVYPNPATGFINVSAPGNQITEIFIMDANGRTFANTRPGKSKIHFDISTLPAGIYFIKVKTENGLLTKTFIKSSSF